MYHRELELLCQSLEIEAIFIFNFPKLDFFFQALLQSAGKKISPIPGPFTAAMMGFGNSMNTLNIFSLFCLEITVGNIKGGKS